MKNFLLAVLALSISFHSFSQETKKDSIIELPIEMVNGIMPFNKRSGMIELVDEFSGTPFEKTIKKTRLELKGIPDKWENSIINTIHFDQIQFYYQNYKQGNIDEELFNSIKKQINFEGLQLSKTPIKCYSHIVLTKLENGNILYRIDTDNDLDFSDEKTFHPKLRSKTKEKSDSLIKQCHWIDGEIFVDGQIKNVKYPYSVERNNNNSPVMENFPQYAKTVYKNKILLISSGFNNPSFRMKSSIIIVDENKKTLETAELNEYLEIEGLLYQNLGVDFNHQILKLKKTTKKGASNMVSTQVGFPMKDFSGTEFSTGESINLSDYKGKFLLVKFWGTWCGPCINEIPKLKSWHSKLDKNKISFLGIAQDNPQALKNFLNKKEIPWKQILSTPENDIIKEFGIHSFPSSLLINEQGVIVAKNFAFIPPPLLKLIQQPNREK